jgi:hypothetical protein
VRYPGPDGQWREERTRARSATQAAEIRAERQAEVAAGTWLPRRERERPEPSPLPAVGIEPLRQGGPSVADVLALYRRHVQPLRRCQTWQEQGLAVIAEEFGALPLDCLTWDRVDLWVRRLLVETVTRRLPPTPKKPGRPLAGAERPELGVRLTPGEIDAVAHHVRHAAPAAASIARLPPRSSA